MAENSLFLTSKVSANAAKRPQSGQLSTESAGNIGPHRLRLALDQLDSGLHQVAN